MKANPLFRSDRSIGLAALGSALIVFALDTLSPLQGAVAVLYTSSVLIASWSNRSYATIAAGGACSVLACAGYWDGHWGAPFGSAALRLGVSLFAIGLTTILSIRHRWARDTLSEQARMLELTHDTVIVRSSNDTIQYWNEGAERLYGWTRSEALGRKAAPLLQTLSSEDPMVSIATTAKWSGEISRIRKDGTRIVLESRWLARRDHLGRDTGIFETSADITVQRAEAFARRQSEERYVTIFHAAGLPILEIDLAAARDIITNAAAIDSEVINRVAAKAVVRDANDAAGRLFGVPDRRQLVGRSLLRFHTPATEHSLGRLLKALSAGERDIEDETLFLTHDGAVIDVVLRFTLQDEDQNWSRLLVLAVNITERNRTHRRLAQAQSELTEVNRVSTLGQVSAFIAHEINQPLSAISAYANSGKRWLSREAPHATEVADCLEKIAVSSARAADVVARVRSLFRKGRAGQSAFDPAALAREAVALLERELRECEIEVRFDLQDDLPALVGDRVMLQQVLVNLILNARDAMASGSRRDLLITVRQERDRIDFDVLDSGTGLLCAPDKVFEPFFSSNEDGMGVGLSISKSIIEQHGGEIEAGNRLEGGAHFRFSLPVALARDAV